MIAIGLVILIAGFVLSYYGADQIFEIDEGKYGSPYGVLGVLVSIIGFVTLAVGFTIPRQHHMAQSPKS